MCEKRFETDPGTVKFDAPQNTSKIKPMLKKGKAWLLVSSVHFFDHTASHVLKSHGPGKSFLALL